MTEFEGIFVVTLSPFRDGRVDERAVRHLVDHFIDAGVQGLVVLGSNGENPYLTEEEKRELIDITVDQTRGRVPVIAGTGCMGTDATIALTRHAREAGAAAALVAMPQYFRIGFADVKRHYTRLTREAGLPILYYNFPAVTRLELSPAEIAELAAIPGMVGAKQTIFDIEEIAELAKLTRDRPFSVLSGTTLNLPALVPRGIRGAIGVLPNLMPRESVELYKAPGGRREEGVGGDGVARQVGEDPGREPDRARHAEGGAPADGASDRADRQGSAPAAHRRAEGAGRGGPGGRQADRLTALLGHPRGGTRDLCAGTALHGVDSGHLRAGHPAPAGVRTAPWATATPRRFSITTRRPSTASRASAPVATPWTGRTSRSPSRSIAASSRSRW
jgi:4-hydroxy-tetrahydrodipicolinate synthase